MKFQKGDTVYFCDIETQEDNPSLDSDTYPVIWRGKVTDIDENGNMHVDLEPNGLSPAVGVKGANIEDLFYRTPEEAVCEFLSDMRQKLEDQIKKLRGGSRMHGKVLQSIESVWGKDAYAIIPDGAENTSPCNVNILRSHISETKQGIYESLVHGLDDLIWDLEKNMDSKVDDLRDQLRKVSAKLKQARAAYVHNRDLLEGLRKEQNGNQDK